MIAQPVAAAPPRLGRAAAALSLEEQYAQPRAAYFLYYPLAMLAAAILLYMVPSDGVLFGASLVGAAVGLLSLWNLTLGRGPFRVSILLGMTLLLAYGLGTANTWLTLPRGGLEISAAFLRSTESLAHGLGTVLIATAFLYSVGELLETPVVGLSFYVQPDGRKYLLMMLGTALLLIDYATGSLSYMGAVLNDNQKLSVMAAAGLWFAAGVFPYCLVLFLNSPRGLMRTVSLGFTVLNFFLLVPLGRRVLGYGVITALFALRFTGVRPRLHWIKTPFYTLLIGGGVLVGSTVFFYMRQSGGSLHGQQGSILERISLAWDFYNQRDSSEVTGKLNSNVQKRTFVLAYLSDLVSASERSRPMYGENLLNQLGFTLPSAFFSDKNQLEAEEQLVDRHWNFAYVDQANSVYTAGVLDFGLAGAIVYPLLIVGLVRLFLLVIKRYWPEMASSFVILVMVAQLLEPETTVTAYVVTIRNGLLFSLAIGILAVLPGFRLRAD